MEQLTHIDLFSGIGGFALAAQWAGFKTVAFVEIEPYAQEILKQNFGAVMADAESIGRRQTTIYSDIRDLDGSRYRGATLLTGGFPCQPFSQAGKRRGKEDDRYLWPEMLRVVCEARPTWIVGENVAGIVNMELDKCISDLEGEGYAVQSLIIPACAVDAPHRRDRVWIIANAKEPRCKTRDGDGLRVEQKSGQGLTSCEGDTDVADAEKRTIRTGLCENEQAGQRRRRFSNSSSEASRWLPEPPVGRVAHGIPRRVDRLKGLGNAIVPQVAYEITRIIAAIEQS